MRCSWVRERLQDHVHGSLSEREAAAVQKHVYSCPNCSAELDAIRALDARLRREVPAYIESIQPSPAFMARLRTLKLEPAKAPRPGVTDRLLGLWQGHRVAMAGSFAAIAVIIIAATMTLTYLEDNGDDQMVAKGDSERTPASSEETLAAQSTAEPAGPEGPQGPRTDDRNVAVPPVPTPVPSPTPRPAEVPGASLGVTETTPAEDTAYGYDFESAPPTEIPPCEPLMLTMPGDGDATEADQQPPPTPERPTPPFFRPYEDQTAVWIAFGDPSVQEAIEGETLRSIEVTQAFAREPYHCTGRTVVLQVEGANKARKTIFVCVDPDAHQVTEVASCQG